MTASTHLWRRTLTAIDPLTRATSLPRASADRGSPSPGSTAKGVTTARSRAVSGRRALHWAATATAAFVIAFLALTAAIAAAAAGLYGLVLLVGWEALAGFAVGAGITVGISEFTGWNRHRKLRELLDWLGEDNQARKMAALRADQRIRYMKGQLP